MRKFEPVEIPLSKKKLSITFLGSLGFVAVGLWFVIKRPISSDHSILSNPVIIFITGMVAILFFGLIAIYCFKKFGDNAPGLIINDMGITDNSSGISAGFIPWKDIVNIKTVTIRNASTIGLEVSDPEKYIKRQKSFLKRMAMEANYKTFDSPIYISSAGLKCDYDELYQLIESNFLARKSDN